MVSWLNMETENKTVYFTIAIFCLLGFIVIYFANKASYYKSLAISFERFVANQERKTDYQIAEQTRISLTESSKRREKEYRDELKSLVSEILKEQKAA